MHVIHVVMVYVHAVDLAHGVCRHVHAHIDIDIYIYIYIYIYRYRYIDIYTCTYIVAVLHVHNM